MAPSKRVILDSEDDDSDFEETTTGGDINVGQTEDEPHDKRHETIIPQTKSTAETDSSLFARAYNQAVALMHPFDASTSSESHIPDTLPPTAGISSESLATVIPNTYPPTAGQTLEAELALSMSSSTRKSGRARTKSQKAAETIDLTTPSKALDTDSVWEVPSSQNVGAGGSAKSTRSSARGKRNRAAETTIQNDPYEFPEATPAPKSKRAKRDTQTSPLPNDVDSSPIVLLPAETPSSLRRSGRNNHDTTGALEVPTQLYVEQSELTMSQKQQYEVVNISSQNGLEVPQPTLPTQLAGFVEVVHKSSGVTVSTIPYSTPSRMDSSRQEMPSTAKSVNTSAEEDGSAGQTDNPQQSSPDVLIDMPASASAKKRGRKKAVTASLATNSSSASRAAKKRKVVYGSDDEMDELDGDYGHEDVSELPTEEPQDLKDETFTPNPELEPAVIETTSAPQEPPAKNKRGRKKKEPTLAEPVAQLDEATVEPPAVVESEEPPSKKRRGRPRKSDVTTAPAPEPLPIEPEVIEEEPAPKPLAEVSRNQQRGRKKAAVEDDEEEEEAHTPDAQEDDEVKKNKKQEQEKLEKQATAEPVVKKKEKPAASKTAADFIAATNKVQYRVGLSKKSRIAPLLKSLKKP
ncbi:hypothetical protein QBC43DRAFT_316762 [Cladorrhinum sp. PSN259]|nr:hypothetical protein QBC43DRAFT_316762 [Cladorrhinum sp. PSN259]